MEKPFPIWQLGEVSQGPAISSANALTFRLPERMLRRTLGQHTLAGRKKKARQPEV